MIRWYLGELLIWQFGLLIIMRLIGIDHFVLRLLLLLLLEVGRGRSIVVELGALHHCLLRVGMGRMHF